MSHVLDLYIQNGHFFSSWKKQSSVVSKKKKKNCCSCLSQGHVESDDASAEKTKRGERCVGFDRE